MKTVLLVAFSLLLAAGPMEGQLMSLNGCQSCSDIVCSSPGTQCRLIPNPNCPKDAACDCAYIPVCAPTRRCKNCDSMACGEGFQCTMIPAGPENFPCQAVPTCSQKSCPPVDVCGLVSCPASTHCEVRHPILTEGTSSCSPAGSANCCPFSICESNQKNHPCAGLTCPEFSFCHIASGGRPRCVTIPPKARFYGLVETPRVADDLIVDVIQSTVPENDDSVVNGITIIGTGGIARRLA